MSGQRNTQAVFLTTRWSVVAQVQGDAPEAHQALEQLCAACWFPLYAFARRSGYAAADAQDLVQGFFVEVVGKDLFSRVDSEKGRLRTFLLTVFKRHMQHVARKDAAQKRGGDADAISIDADDAEHWYAEELVEGETAEHMYDRQWALGLLEAVINDLATDWSQRGKAEMFAALRPYLSDVAGGEDYSDLEQRLGMSRTALKSAVHRLRGQFRERLVARVKDTQLDGEDHEGELQVLLQALS